MNRLKNWTAIRSGAHITVEGIDEKGETKKLTGIVFIQSGNPFPQAVAEDDAVTELMHDD